MSLDYSTLITTGILLKTSELKKAFNWRVVGYEEHKEDRFDPKTGEKVEPETVVDSHGRDVFTVAGVDHDFDYEEHVGSANAILAAFLEGVDDRIEVEVEMSNCETDLSAIIHVKDKYVCDDLTKTTGGFIVPSLSQEEMELLETVAEDLRTCGLEAQISTVVINSVW